MSDARLSALSPAAPVFRRGDRSSAVTEIRQFGGESIQVARRLRAMLENLIQTLPEARSALLRQELELLHRSTERFFPDPEYRSRADVADYQGVGGTPGGRFGPADRGRGFDVTGKECGPECRS